MYTLHVGESQSGKAYTFQIIHKSRSRNPQTRKRDGSDFTGKQSTKVKDAKLKPSV